MDIKDDDWGIGDELLEEVGYIKDNTPVDTGLITYIQEPKTDDIVGLNEVNKMAYGEEQGTLNTICIDLENKEICIDNNGIDWLNMKELKALITKLKDLKWL